MVNQYELFHNRLVNGKPFRKDEATNRVATMINRLEITQEQADELMAIIDANGVDVLPDDAVGRLDKLTEDSIQTRADVDYMSIILGVELV